MATGAGEERLITPQWLIQARNNRVLFLIRVLVLFAILSILAWWALPLLRSKGHLMIEKTGEDGLPGPVGLLVSLAGMFKVLWGGIAIGCGVALFLAMTGAMDRLVPLFNIILFWAGAALVGLTAYILYKAYALRIPQVLFPDPGSGPFC